MTTHRLETVSHVGVTGCSDCPLVHMALDLDTKPPLFSPVPHCGHPESSCPRIYLEAMAEDDTHESCPLRKHKLVLRLV